MLCHLSARGFRNLQPLSWSVGAGSHLLLGGTGAGKTSVLEALYVVATTRSFRVPQIADCVTRRPDGEKEQGFELAAEVETDGRTRLEVGYLGGEGGWRRLNGKRSSLGEHLGQLAVVAWTAADNEVLLGGPGGRRRFLDRGVVGCRPSAIDVLSRYRRILDHKRGLLAHGQMGQGGQEGLESWNELLARSAVELVSLRQAYVRQLSAALQETLAESGLPLPAIELSYEPSPREALDGYEEVMRALAAVARQERDRQRPLIGPHGDRLHILWRERPVREVASAGERKSLGLMLAAAQVRVWRRAGRQPVLLLDDADAELDRPTLVALWSVLAQEPQLFLSSNRPEAWEGLDIGARWAVRKGRVEGDS